MSPDVAVEIQRLREEVRYHDRKYYLEAAPKSATSSMIGCSNG